MSSFFSAIGRIFGSLSEPKVKNKNPVQHIDGSESVIVDSSILTCPVCYEPYASAPEVLLCGHTFCAKCAARLRTDKNTLVWKRNRMYFLCPLCREPDPCHRPAQRNWIVEDLLKTIDSVDDEQQKFVAPTLRFANKRLRAQHTQMEKEVERLKREVDDRDAIIQKLWYGLGAAVVVVSVWLMG